MKKTFIGVFVFASAGLLFQTAFSNDAQSNASQGAMHLQRATELIGMDVRNQEDEKLGAINDVMVNLQSGHAPFTIVSSGGFFGVGDRLLAVPTSTFSQTPSHDQFILSMDRERLRNAPGFDKNGWPDMSDQSWRSEVYSYYGQSAPSDTSFAETTTEVEINEAAGAQPPLTSSQQSWLSQSYGETSTGLSRDRTPRQGLGAEDLTKNHQDIYNPGGYAESDAFFSESSGAKTGRSTGTTTYQGHRYQTDAARTHPAKVRRATEIIGMEVKNAQDERIGEIQDVVLDMQSGRVAYAVLDAGGIAGAEDRLYAVPPTVFAQSSDERWLVFNTDREKLRNAPGFTRNDWSRINNQQFTTEVYQFYQQQPYWRMSRQMNEPSGGGIQRRDSQDSSSEWQKGERQNLDYQGQIQEPAGATPSQTPGGELQPQPSQTEPERSQSYPANEPNGSQSPNQNQSSAEKETAELQSTPQYQQQNQIQEPAGATAESTAPATSEDQAASPSDRRMSEQLRTTLQGDSELSGAASKVTVSASNGRITLRGTVSSEQEKQAIAAKAQEIAGSADKVDNQLQVNGNLSNP